MRSLIFFVTLSCLTSAQADSLRCGDQIVSSGASAAEVLLRCGPPFHRLERQEKVVIEEGSSRRRSVRQLEEWLYNHGPNHFIQLLTFEEGKLTTIRSGGYGVAQPPAPELCQEGRAIVVGMSAGEMTLVCGSPLQRQKRSEEDVVLETGKKLRTTIEWEEWLYNFGANRFMVRVKLRQGRVTEVTSDGYGFGDGHP